MIEAMPEMVDGLFEWITDRVVANARVIRRAPEAIAITIIVAVAISYFALQHFQRERFTALDNRITSQERLPTEYRTKLKGATSDEAAAQIEKLASLLASTQKSLREAKNKPAPVENRTRDPRRLYEDNHPIAEVQVPKVDLDKKKIMFPVVNSRIILGINKVYEFQNWKLACGGTQLYSTISDGAGDEYSYSPLTCKILGNQ